MSDEKEVRHPKNFTKVEKDGMMKSLEYLDEFINNLPGGNSFWVDPDGGEHYTDVAYGIDLWNQVSEYLRGAMDKQPTKDIIVYASFGTMILRVNYYELDEMCSRSHANRLYPIDVIKRAIEIHNMCIARAKEQKDHIITGEDAAILAVLYSSVVAVYPSRSDSDIFRYTMTSNTADKILMMGHLDAKIMFDYTHIKISEPKDTTPIFSFSMDLPWYFLNMKRLDMIETISTDTCVKRIVDDVTIKVMQKGYREVRDSVKSGSETAETEG